MTAPIQPTPQIWVNADRTVMVVRWALQDVITVSLRKTSDDVWGPPIAVRPENER